MVAWLRVHERASCIFRLFEFCFLSGIKGHEHVDDPCQVSWERWSLCGDRIAAIGETSAASETLTNLFFKGSWCSGSHSLSMREALGSIPSESTFMFRIFYAPHPMRVLRAAC
jgi:hypothetical protein